jgi:hypothetical protein
MCERRARNQKLINGFICPVGGGEHHPSFFIGGGVPWGLRVELSITATWPKGVAASRRLASRPKLASPLREWRRRRIR